MMKQWKGKPDVIVAGAGFAGAVAAREMAEAGKQVLVLEKETILAEICMKKKMKRVSVSMFMVLISSIPMMRKFFTISGDLENGIHMNIG